MSLLLSGMPAARISASAFDANVKSALEAQALRSYVEDPTRPSKLDPELVERLNAMRAIGSRCGSAADDATWFRQYLQLLNFVSFFDADTTRAVVAYLTPHPCAAPREIEKWLALLDAAGTRQWDRAAQIGDNLLPASQPLPASLQREQAETIERVLLVADLKSGNITRARQRLRGWHRREPDSAGFAFLRAIIEQGS
ncbi:MAG TPA: hypothetical protein VFB36_00965 [Nevskiaceae bacterium]|nr:hypothetical protein [Nevskiaceae bacterium]